MKKNSLRNVNEPLIVKIIEWAQRHNKPVNRLTAKDVREALKSH